jgi:predicted dehydrogenase
MVARARPREDSHLTRRICAMKIGLLGTGFGVAHAGIYHRHPAVDEVIVFGRTQAKLEKIAAEFGFATTSELDAIYDDPSIDLVDVCVPTRLHADHVVRGLASRQARAL